MSGPSLRRSGSPAGLAPPQTLIDRFTDEDLKLMGADGSWDINDVAWELLYRKEPALYHRLVSAEALNPLMIDWLPTDVGRGIEIGAGTGRLTVPLSQRCQSLLAIEPAPAARELLRDELGRASASNVEVLDGSFDALPAGDSDADLVVACSSFTPHPTHGGENGLAEMKRVARQGGLIVIVCPTDVGWLKERGFFHIQFEGEMFAEYASVEEALEIARIFYPWAVQTIEDQRLERVGYNVLRIKPPNDLCWKRA
jgi:SAM-dependent methyltransferase